MLLESTLSYTNFYAPSWLLLTQLSSPLGYVLLSPLHGSSASLFCTLLQNGFSSLNLSEQVSVGWDVQSFGKCPGVEYQSHKVDLPLAL